jgi:hypothetical protein
MMMETMATDGNQLAAARKVGILCFCPTVPPNSAAL